MGLTRNHSVKWVFILSLPFVMFLFSRSPAYGQWTSVTPPYVSANWDLSGVHFTSANEGWAVGPDLSTSTGVLLSYHGVTNVTLVSPNGGEPVPAGELYPVSWEAPAAATKFKLQYSMDNKITWKPMVQGLVPGRSYDWQVPVPANNKRKCLVKITGYNENSVRIGRDISDAPFTIEVLKLDAPNGGEPLISQAQFPITWTTNPNVPSVHHVQLSYTLNNGVTWKAINTTGDPSDDGNFLWTVPNVTMERKKCKVKIVLKSTSGKTLGSDISDDPFTIRPAP